MQASWVVKAVILHGIVAEAVLVESMEWRWRESPAGNRRDDRDVRSRRSEMLNRPRIHEQPLSTHPPGGELAEAGAPSRELERSS